MVNHKTEKVNFSELCNFYRKDGEVKENLFADTAEIIVKDFFRPQVTKTQIRKFYEELLSIQNLIETAEDKQKAFKTQVPYIKMLVAKATYAEKRRPPKVNAYFVQFIKNCVADIKIDGAEIKKSMKHFDIFVSFFEAIIAYSVAYLDKN